METPRCATAILEAIWIKLIFYLSGIHLRDTGTVSLLRFGSETANGGCRTTGEKFAERLLSNGGRERLSGF